MADVKPIFQVKADFYASLDRFINEAGMLSDAVRQALQLGGLGPSEGIIRKRLKAFDMARFGEIVE